MYYECHITIEPMFGEMLEQIKQLASQQKFRVAELLMKKREEDTEERSMYDTFMTGHSLEENDIQERMVALIKSLQQVGIKVWRYKIEYIIMDSRKHDVLTLL